MHSLSSSPDVGFVCETSRSYTVHAKSARRYSDNEFEGTICEDRSYALCASVAPNLPRARPMPTTLMKKPTKMPSGHKNPRVPAT
jgi:hypothetical protein